MSRPKLFDHREVLEARESYVNVQLRLNALKKQAGDLNQQVTKNRKNIDHAVDKYLKGEDYEHKDVQQEMTSSLEKINSERRIAYKALEKQKRAVAEAEAKASKLICKKVKPEYVVIIKNMSQVLLQVQEVAVEEVKFRHLLDSESISFSGWIPPVVFRPAGGLGGHFDQQYSIIGHWHRMAVENGYLKPADISKHWREIWNLDYVQMVEQTKGNGEASPENTVKKNEDGWLNFN